MRQAIEAIVVTIVVVLVVALSLRRLVFLWASLVRSRPLAPVGSTPTVTVIVSARNERAVADRLLAALGALSYPAERLSFILVCDGCTDETPARFNAWAEGRRDARVLELPLSGGKAAALNAGVGMVESELVVVLDADLEPLSDFVAQLVRPFAEVRVAAAAAFVRPSNPDANIITRYAAVNTWVHQLVTSAGTDRLGLNPPTLGAAAYRTSVLVTIGGFAPIPSGEDVATSATLIRRGWQTRFVDSAIAGNTVASDLGEYWRQHVRWTRGLFLARRDAAPSRASVAQRMESVAASLGYADRLVFASALAGAMVDVVPGWVSLLYLAVPGLEVLTALFKAGIRRRIPAYLVATLVFFVADLAASAAAVVMHAMRRPHAWHNPRAVTAGTAAE